MTNRLADETSPYLLQHKDNPVDWWPWSAEAFAEARRRDVRSSSRSATPRATGAMWQCYARVHESRRQMRLQRAVFAREVLVDTEL